MRDLKKNFENLKRINRALEVNEMRANLGVKGCGKIERGLIKQLETIIKNSK
jgi:inhibitor of KinA sporulation pathway (predicted exonuclease)